MAPKQPCVKYEYVVTSTGPKILPVDPPPSKEEESPADYNAGGYLPVKVGDVFNNNRYRVIRKLGWGHFSTVWLVKDSHTRRHSALKVVKSAGRYAETARDEIKLLSRVSSFSPNHLGREHIVSFLDSFSHQGPEASHVCIVFEPLGENLLALIERNKKKGVPRPLVKVIAKQILLGLEYLHDECDLVHTDIKPENILISIPDIETHIHTELSLSPSPTSRRVGVPPPTKSRAGVPIPLNQQQRARRQVQIFDSQPLSSPGRSGSAHMRSALGANVRRDSTNAAGSVSQIGSYVAQVQMTRSGYIHSSGTVASLSSSAPKIPSGLSASAPRTDASQKTVTQPCPTKGITAIPARVVNSPSTSSSSSSISSVVASTTAGSSSLVSTPPTSLSHSIGNVVMEFMGTGKFERELRTRPRELPASKIADHDQREGVPITQKKNAGETDLEAQISSAISTSFKQTGVVSGSWKDKIVGSFQSLKSSASPNKSSNQRSVRHGHTRSNSGLSNANFWKDPGLAAPAPAILVSTVVGADERQDDFPTAPSSTASTVRPSPASTPLPIAKKPVSLANGVSKLVNGSPNIFNETLREQSTTRKATNDTSAPAQPLSLLTQTAPPRKEPSSSQRAVVHRASPPRQISQLSAHMHLHKPLSPDDCSNPVHNHSTLRTHTKSRASRHVEHPSIATVLPILSSSVTPTPASPVPTSPTLTAPPPTPTDSPTLPAADLHVSSPKPIARPNATSNADRIASDTPSPPRYAVPETYSAPMISIKIADLGNATPSKKHFTEDIQTRQYRAPEAIIGRRDWDARADIWSVACVVFELLTAEYLFDPQGQGELFSKDDDHMAQIIELLGDFSLDVKMGGKYSRELFDHTGALRYIKTLKPWPLKRVMMEKYLFSEPDADLLCKFLEPMLAIDMRERSNARDLKDHPWLEPNVEDGIITEW
ncbi:kinase-like protein [Agrocybe pediades]|nr:kinase-like protein [Agrocybe pediades]